MSTTTKRGRAGGEDGGGTKKKRGKDKKKMVNFSFQGDIAPRISNGSFTLVLDSAIYEEYSVQATRILPDVGVKESAISIEGTFLVLRKEINVKFLDYFKQMPASLLEMVDSVTEDDWGCKEEEADFPDTVTVTATPISTLFHMMAAFLIRVNHIADATARAKTEAQAKEFLAITRLFTSDNAFQSILDADGSKLPIIVNFDTKLQAYIDSTDAAEASEMEKGFQFLVDISRTFGARFNKAKKHRAQVDRIIELTKNKTPLSDIARMTAIEDVKTFMMNSNRKEEWTEIRVDLAAEWEKKITPTGAAPAQAGDDQKKITLTLAKIIQRASIEELKATTGFWAHFFAVKHTRLEEIQAALAPYDTIIQKLKDTAESIVGCPWENLESPWIKKRTEIVTKELWELLDRLKIPNGKETYPEDKVLELILSVSKQILKGVNTRCEMYIKTGRTYFEKDSYLKVPSHLELFKNVATWMGQQKCGDLLRDVSAKTTNQPRPTMFRVKFSLDAFKQDSFGNSENATMVPKQNVYDAGSFYFKNFHIIAPATFATIGFFFKWLPLDDMNIVTPYIDEAIDVILKYRYLAPIAREVAWDLLFLYTHYAGNDQAKNAEEFNRHTNNRGGTKTTVQVEKIEVVEVTEEEAKNKNIRVVFAAIAGSDDMRLVDAAKMDVFAADPIFTVEKASDGTEVLNIDQVAKEPARPAPPPPEVSAESGAGAMETEAGAGGGHEVDESRLLSNPLDADTKKFFQEPLIQKVFEQLAIPLESDNELREAVSYQTRRFVNEHLSRLTVNSTIKRKKQDERIAHIAKQTQAHMTFGEMTEHLIQAKSSFQRNLYPTAILLIIIKEVYEHLKRPVPEHVTFAAIERDVQALAAAAEIPAETDEEPALKTTRSAGSADGSGGAAAGPP